MNRLKLKVCRSFHTGRSGIKNDKSCVRQQNQARRSKSKCQPPCNIWLCLWNYDQPQSWCWTDSIYINCWFSTSKYARIKIYLIKGTNSINEALFRSTCELLQSIPHCCRRLTWVSASSGTESADAMQARKHAMLGASRNMISILKRGNAASSCRRLSVSAGGEILALTRRTVASKISARASPAGQCQRNY